MNIDDKEMMKAWVDSWKRAGQALKEVKRRELRVFDYAMHRDRVDEMLQWAFVHRKVRAGSGLVEMQRIFKQIRGGLD